MQLIVNPQYLRKARSLFHGTGVVTTDASKHHLGSALGTNEYQTGYGQSLHGWASFLKSPITGSLYGLYTFVSGSLITCCLNSAFDF